MKKGLETGPLSLPSRKEEIRMELMPLREKEKNNRAELIRQLGELEDIAARLDVDLKNDYDERMKNTSYAGLRNFLLARGMAIGEELEEVEDFLEHITERLGEQREHDA
jgi:hypothetical protein